MNYCPCCTDILLRHTNGNGIYWFCRTCWQAMPVSEYNKADSLTEISSNNLSQIINKLKKATSLTASQTEDTKSSNQSDVSPTGLVEISS